MGILFNPIIPESAEFTIKVTPEFSSRIISITIVTVTMDVLIGLTRFRKIG